MANPQPDKFTRISNELYEAIMQTDFSKRQRNIMDLVIRMSYGCRKKFALLRPSDFELVGVYKTHIRKELDYLVSTKVLFIHDERIEINKNYEEWRVSLIKTANHEKYLEVLRRNLSLASDEKITKTVTKNDDNEVTETVTKVTKLVTIGDVQGYQNSNQGVTETVIKSYQNSNSPVTKTVTETPEKALNHALCEAPKDNIKDIKDNIKTIYKEKEEEKLTENPFAFFEQNGFGMLSPHVAEKIGSWIDDGSFDEPESIIIHAMEIAVENSAINWGYVNSILVDWSRRKLRRLRDVLAHQAQFRRRKQAKREPSVKQDKLPEWIENRNITGQQVDRTSDEEKRRRAEELMKLLEKQEVVP